MRGNLGRLRLASGGCWEDWCVQMPPIQQGDGRSGASIPTKPEAPRLPLLVSSLSLSLCLSSLHRALGLCWDRGTPPQCLSTWLACGMLVCSYGSYPRGQALHPIIMVWGSSSLGPPHDQPEFEHHLDQNFLLLGFMPATGFLESSVLAAMKRRLPGLSVGPLGSLGPGYARLVCKHQMLTHTQFTSQRLLREGKDVLLPREPHSIRGNPTSLCLVTSLQGWGTPGGQNCLCWVVWVRGPPVA